MKSHFDTNNYQEFLNELQSVTSIDSRILDNLIKLDLIKSIFQDNQSISIEENSFSFFMPQLNYNYKFQIEFIFASYPIYDKNFDKVLYDSNFNCFKRRIINNSGLKSFISLDRNQLSSQLSFVIESSFQLFSDHDISLLNFEENVHFKNYITLAFMDNLEFAPIQSSNHLFLVFKPLTVLMSNDNINQHIKASEHRYIERIEEIKTKHKIEIDAIFERVLLEQEMKSF